MQAGMIGHGVPNLEVVDDPFRYFNDIDLFIFPDLNYGPFQKYLRQLGKPVWGSGLGEDMEQNRVLMKSIQRKAGLLVGDFEIVIGLDNLREHIDKNPGGYVKISKWRGSFESFKATDLKTVEPLLNKISQELGPFASIVEFVVEAPIDDAIELGMDAYVIDGHHPSRLLAGLEIKDSAYVGVAREWSELPEPLTRVSSALEPSFKRYGYRGAYSTEVRITKDGDPYLIDMTCRLPSPPNELYQEFYTNLAEIVWYGANGHVIDPEFAGKYGAQIRLKSAWAKTEWQPVDGVTDRVKLINPVVIDGRWYVIPQTCGMTEVGSVIGWGNTLEDAIADARAVAETVSGYGIKADSHALDDAQEEVDKCEEFGLGMF
jgi:hypothetical protein